MAEKCSIDNIVSTKLEIISEQIKKAG